MHKPLILLKINAFKWIFAGIPPIATEALDQRLLAVHKSSPRKPIFPIPASRHHEAFGTMRLPAQP
ncbi:MAG: hypothetical protein LBE81_05480 [Azonexus sp.]|jgi:hypothetical protein|uniref:hypothetical protein n=1 Tax=Azonexus sp. TaxID=1872668 RepID=UPI00281907BA|nr:hypothetical protein [Azonexus sp.]MDR0776072.1 hypothetical protein [Azonexus sp.]